MPDPDTHPHQWVAATTTPLTGVQAQMGVLRGLLWLPKGAKFVVHEVYCGACRRPYESVEGQACSALVNNEHLRGGPIGTRKKRGKQTHQGMAPGRGVGSFG